MICLGSPAQMDSPQPISFVKRLASSAWDRTFRRDDSILPSDHFDGKRFFNPSGKGGHRSSLFYLPFPTKGGPPALRTDTTSLPTPAHNEIVVTFISHASFLIQTHVGNVVTDPAWTDRMSVFRPGAPRVGQTGIDFDKLPPIRVVLLSHDHCDHLDLPTLAALAKHHDPLFVAGLRTAGLLRSRSIRRVMELDWWQVFNVGGLCLTMTPAQHGSGRHPMDRNRRLWGSFVIETLTARLFFGGDTGYALHFRTIRRRCGTIDVALLPISCMSQIVGTITSRRTTPSRPTAISRHGKALRCSLVRLRRTAPASLIWRWRFRAH
jgi:L-ascorbate metabolism protein UlaG (beta-lactamase superfamily)